MMSIFVCALCAVAGAGLFYVRFVIFTHWKRLRFDFIAPMLPFGNLSSTMLRQTSFGCNIRQLYDRSTAPLVGIFLLWRPALLVRCPRLARRMLGPDFAHFHDRGMYSRPHDDPMSDNLFVMNGQRWRTMRAQLTPTFTTGRLRGVVPTMLTKADQLVRTLRGPADGDGKQVVDLKDFASRYGLDCIAPVLFGLDVDTIEDGQHTFRLIEHYANNHRYFYNLVPALVFLCPGFLKFSRLPCVPPEAKPYLLRLVNGQIEQRQREYAIRNDFMQSLIQIRNAGNPTADKQIQELASFDSEDVEAATAMSVEQCAAHVFLFYLAGFDTSASMAVYTVFETARHPRVLRLLCREIDETLHRHGGQLTYECIGEMKYLELCMKETARKYPVLPLLNRICTKEYTVPGTGQTIPVGTPIVISLLGFARDAQHFPDPLEYRPERFVAGVQPAPYTEDAFLPYGDGPRRCIGIRMGKMIAKIFVIKLLAAYRFEPVSAAELEFENYGITLHVRGGIPMRIAHR